MRNQTAKLITVWSLLTILGSHAGAADLCPSQTQTPTFRLSKTQAIRVIAKEKGYTEGLIFHQGYLYESLGLYGRSELRKIDPYTGIPETIRFLEPNFFAEGLTQSNGQLIQLTYKENVVFTYSADEKLAKTTPHIGEGWGLTQINGELVKSNGSNKLLFLDPRTLATKREVTVRDNTRSYDMINELEQARGMILANIFGRDDVLMINPLNGCVLGRIDLTPLRTKATLDPTDAHCDNPGKCVPLDFATNGIAYDDGKDELYFTGKNWPYIFVFKFPR